MLYLHRCGSGTLQFVGDAVHKLLGGLHAASQHEPEPYRHGATVFKQQYVSYRKQIESSRIIKFAEEHLT